MWNFPRPGSKPMPPASLCSSPPTPDCEPSFYIIPQAPHWRGGGGTVLETGACCVLPPPAIPPPRGLKSPFCFPRALSLYFLFGFSGQRKPRFQWQPLVCELVSSIYHTGRDMELGEASGITQSLPVVNPWGNGGPECHHGWLSKATWQSGS